METRQRRLRGIKSRTCSLGKRTSLGFRDIRCAVTMVLKIPLRQGALGLNLDKRQQTLHRQPQEIDDALDPLSFQGRDGGFFPVEVRTRAETKQRFFALEKLTWKTER